MRRPSEAEAEVSIVDFEPMARTYIRSVLGEQHLRHLLKSYQNYYNEARTRLSLQKDAPVPRAVQAVGETLAVPILGGLHHQYIRARVFDRDRGLFLAVLWPKSPA